MNNTAHSLLRLGEFRCLNISSLIKTVSWRNQDGAKLLAKVEGRKTTLGKNNPVYSILHFLDRLLESVQLSSYYMWYMYMYF